jgi:hypothetical protein
VVVLVLVLVLVLVPVVVLVLVPVVVLVLVVVPVLVLVLMHMLDSLHQFPSRMAHLKHTPLLCTSRNFSIHLMQELPR